MESKREKEETFRLRPLLAKQEEKSFYLEAQILRAPKSALCLVPKIQLSNYCMFLKKLAHTHAHI